MTHESIPDEGFRASEARRTLANALRECGELADAVEAFEGEELRDVLDYIDSLRLVMADSTLILIGVVRGDIS